jgi:hypothetical protein
MLERVSAALTKLLAPITSSLNNSLDSSLGTKEGFQRHKKKEAKEESKEEGKEKEPKPKVDPRVDPIKLGPHLTLVSPPEPQKTASNTFGSPSIITDIFSLFKEQHALMRRWGGVKMYESSLRSKSMFQLRKGTILDENAD